KAGGYSNDSVNATFLIAANSGKSGADAMHTIALMTAPLRDSIASLEPFQNFQFNDRTLALQGEETGISGLGVVDLSDSMKFFKDRGYTNDTISQLAELLLAGNAMIVTNKGSVPMTPEQAKEYVKSVSNEVKNTGTDEIRTTNNNDIGLPKGSGLQFEFFNEHNITSHFVTKYSVALALTAIEMRAQGKTKAIEIPELDDAARALARNFGDMLKQANVTTSQPDTRTGYVPVGKHSDIDLVRR
ncbi:MAG: hypothetical protein ACOYJ2_09395, partial [Rickettsiales bacterium]